MQIKHKTGRWLAALAAALFGFAAQPAHADLLKQIASIQGVRTNQLLGYGLMVGLDGTGDQTTQAPFTAQSMQSHPGSIGEGSSRNLALRMLARPPSPLTPSVITAGCSSSSRVSGTSPDRRCSTSACCMARPCA